MESLYVIQLQNNKWYIGKTKNFNERMTQHIIGDGAYWTQLHGPQISCSVIGQFPDAAEEETKKTLEYMYKKGINNVRGAEYCKPTNFTVEDAKQLSFAFIHHIPGSNQSDVEKVFIRSIQSDTASPTRTSNRQETTTPIRNSSTITHSSDCVCTKCIVDDLLKSVNICKPIIKPKQNCLICSVEIEKNPNKPFCYDCYNDIPNNKQRCRICSDKIPNDPSKPLCYECFLDEKNSSNSYKRKRCRDCGDFIPNDPDKPYCYDCYLDNRW